MKRSTHRFLTTHVGSLIRPESIRGFGQAAARGERIDRQAYEATLRSEVAEVVREQAQCGVDVVSDGEFGKSGWTDYIFERITGFEQRQIPRPRVGHKGWDAEGRFQGFYEPDGVHRTQMPQAVCVGPITYTEQGKAIMRRDVANLKAALQAVKVEEAFLPVVAPCSISINYRSEHHKSEEEFLFAVADALHEEYKIIVDAGLVLQTDDAVLTNLHDAVVDSGRDYRKWVGMNVAALNHALRGIPADRVRYHLCWGSWPGPHTTDVPLAKIVDLVLQINCQAYSIEAANPRHEWEWQVWEQTRLPEDKILLPGMISHSTAHVEHPELIAQRILRYAKLVGPENVIASSDCGFAQGTATARQHPAIVWAKLEALAEGARLATQRLRR